MTVAIEVNKPTYDLLIEKCKKIRAEIGIDVPDNELIIDIMDTLIDRLDEVDL